MNVSSSLRMLDCPETRPNLMESLVTSPELPADDSEPKPLRSESASSGEPQDSATPSPEETTVPSEFDEQADDDLPDWEPLTPELLEDEAIRGDFVLRWVVIGLALLLGVSQIDQTTVLTHIRAGQHLASHGILPSGADPFAGAPEQRTWVHLSWLFDLVTAGIYGIGGGIGLTLAQGLLVGLAFGLLVHAALPHVRTWWTAICAVLAILATQDQFTWGTHLVTLVGVSAMLWCLVRFHLSPGRWLVPAAGAIQLIWTQCDPRAPFGVLLLLAFALGEQLRRNSSRDARRWLWQSAGVAAIAGLIHPFPAQSYLLFAGRYTTVLPAARAIYSPSDIEFQRALPSFARMLWESPGIPLLATVLLVVLMLACLSLNRSSIRWNWGLVAALGIGFGIAAYEDMAVLALVCVAVASINAQEWYVRRFGQQYRVDWREILFSRSGRAATVLSFFLLAWTMTSGILNGPAGRRPGLGFSQSLTGQMADYQQVIEQIPDRRPFHTHPSQGDLLIWAGGQSTVDSRVLAFTSPAGRAIIDDFQTIRAAFRPEQAGSPINFEARERLDHHEFTTVLPRLAGLERAPDYATMLSLLQMPGWQMVALNGSTAAFCRSDTGNAELNAFLAAAAGDLTRAVFDRNEPLPTEARIAPVPPTFYQKWFYLPRPDRSSKTNAAQHAVILASANVPMSVRSRAAMSLSAIRSASETLDRNPQSIEAYRLLATGHRQLRDFEAALVRGEGMQPISGRHDLQILGALRQALVLAPNDASVAYELFEACRQQMRVDLALMALRITLDELAKNGNSSEEQAERVLELREIANDLEAHVAELETNVGKLRESAKQQADGVLAAAAQSRAGGCQLLAIRLLREDPVLLATTPVAQFLLATALLETGDVFEAHQILEPLSRAPDFAQLPGGPGLFALSSSLVGNLPEAINRWQQDVRGGDLKRLESLLLTDPLTAAPPFELSQIPRPLPLTAIWQETVEQYLPSSAGVDAELALCQLEQGSREASIESWNRTLDRSPAGPARILARFYLYCLTDELPDPEPNTDWPPIEFAEPANSKPEAP
jgi:tetratricopeptide (TPR) repeat protein